MILTSQVEYFTTIFAWYFYNITVDLLVSIGFVQLVFIFIMIQPMLDVRENRDASDIGILLLRKIEISLYAAMLIFITAFYPFVNLNISKQLVTGKSCELTAADTFNEDEVTETISNPAGISSSIQHPNQNEVYLNGYRVQIPLWFSFSEAMFRGIAKTLRNSIPCHVNINEFLAALNSVRITDNPPLAKEYELFYNQCYRPSYRYFTESPHLQTDIQEAVASLQPATGIRYPFNGTFAKNAFNQAFAEDIKFVGSLYFLNTSQYGFYQSTRATTAISTLDENNQPIYPPLAPSDPNYNNDYFHDGQFGKPLCSDWWDDSDKGLKRRIWSNLRSQEQFQNEHYWNYGITTIWTCGSQLRCEYDAMKAYLNNEQELGITESNIIDESNRGVDGTILRAGAYGLGTIGLILESFVTESARTIAPAVSDIILMISIILIPFPLLFSFNFQTLITVTMYLFSIHLWKYVFAVIDFLHLNLVDLIYGRGTGYSRIYTSLFESMLMFLINSLYFVVPIIVSVIFGLAGYSGSQAIANNVSGGIQRTKPPMPKVRVSKSKSK